MAKWTQAFIETFTLEMGREPTKKEIVRNTPLKIIAEVNPKKKGTMSYDRFQGYLDNRDDIYTIGDAFDNGLRQDDIRHDSEHGFILLGDDVENHDAQGELQL